MAVYTISDNCEVKWDGCPQFSYLNYSSKGLPVAREEFNHRRRLGQHAYLWEWVPGRDEPRLIESYEPTSS